MERKIFENKRLIFYLLIILYSVGVLIHLIKFFKYVVTILTPFFLLLVFIIIIFEQKLEKKFLLWLALSYIFTVSAEIIGVHKGWIFGSYHYGENLGVKFLNVPLVIGLNWIALILGSINMVSKLNVSNFGKAITAGFLMVIFDFVLEFAAPKLNYWFWESGHIPIQNFISWFLISFLLVYFYLSLQIKRDLIFARINFILQLIFFLLILTFGSN